MRQLGSEIRQIEKASQRLVSQALFSLVAIAATLAGIVAMETMGGIERFTGPILSILWCLGFALWSLRAVRSHRSKFGIGTVLCITAIVAVGLSSLAGRIIVLARAGLAMVFDVFVKRDGDNTQLHYFSRTIQVLAGVTCMAHASRVIYHSVLK